MFRKTIIGLSVLTAAVSGSVTAPSSVETTDTTATVDNIAAGGSPDGITAVGEALYAPSALELATKPKATAAAARSACQDSAHNFAAWRLPSSFSWSYNGTGVPASVRSTALTAVRNATWTLFHAGYACGGATNLGITDLYLGGTRRAAQVSADASCTGNDKKSVVSWGTLPSNILAYTCTYYRTSSKTVIASDTLINNSTHKWFTRLPASCSNQFDLQSVMVHERGHSAGLEHVDRVAHATQTMSGRTPPCSTARRTLGAGDVTGLKTKYLG